MRFADLLGLSLSALWQQKLRAFLTTLGVVFGALVLVFSLSLGQGVQNTIKRESGRDVFLRRIDVHPEWWGNDPELPTELEPVSGNMSEERRQRLREALTERKMRNTYRTPRGALTLERLEKMRQLPHVVSVTPLVNGQGWASYEGQTQQVSTSSSDPDNENHRKRLIAGEFFHTPDERRVVLSEVTCYRLGVIDDADVQRLIGKKLRLEFRNAPPPVGLNVWLFKGDGSEPTSQENLAVSKINAQLPAALERFDLTADERAALRRALQQPVRPATVYQEEFTIAGVVRLPTKEEQRGPWDSLNNDADVLLPRQTAEELFFRQKERAAQGVDQASILVDHEENVRPVLEQVTAMKLNAFAPLEYIERERLIYLLIFTTMACVAAVALLVAALGIANTMLMSVLERTREIGIFKAVGAGDGTVQLIFLLEGAFIGLIGGGVGLLLGWAASFPADAWVRSMVSRDLKIELKESLFVFPWWLSVGVILFTLLVTTAAAVFPARRAARIKPVTALRNE